jgi:hypothetical protein
MENSPATGDGSRSFRTKSNAASDKLEIKNALSAVIQNLVALALQLNALAQHLGSATFLDQEHELDGSDCSVQHDCSEHLEERWRVEQDADFVYEFPEVTCSICSGDYTSEVYGYAPTEPDEIEDWGA